MNTAEIVLATWTGLNATVRHLDEDGCAKLLDAERVGRRRLMFLLRIHSRINRLRADRERGELRKIAGRGR